MTKLVNRYFAQTRKLLRTQMRRKYGRNMNSAWARYQEEHRGKPMTKTYVQQIKRQFKEA